MIPHDEAANLAQTILFFRRQRSDHLPAELFGETGWEYLLELFVADACGERLTGRQVAERSGAKPAVASRWLKHLSLIGLVIGDGDGDLDDLLTLSPRALQQVEAVLAIGDALYRNIAAAHRRAAAGGS